MKSTRWSRWVSVVMLGLTDCSAGEVVPGLHSQGAIRTERSLYLVAPDEGTLAASAAGPLQVSGEPTRIARVGAKIYVSMRSARRVDIYRESDRGLVLDGAIDVGVEPVGIVGSPDGRLLYVAASMSGLVEAHDLERGTLVRRIAVPGEPRWLAVHPSGSRLYVATTRDGLYQVDLEREGSAPILMYVPGFVRGATSTVRLTGDPAILADGSKLFVPAIGIRTAAPLAPSRFPYYAESRFEPGVVMIDLDDRGDPRPPVATMLTPTSDPQGRMSLEGYPSAVVPSPDGSVIVIACESGDRLAIMALPPPATYGSVFERTSAPTVFVTTPGGARSIVFEDDRRFAVYSFVARTLTSYDLGDVPDLLRTYEPDWVKIAATVKLQASTSIVDQVLTAQREVGRRLFYTSQDPRITAPGSLASCGTCHFEGRDDGVTWNPPGEGPRQTPSLAGGVARTAPFRWTGDRATLEEDAARTITELMSGSGLPPEDLAAIGSYIDSIRAVDRPETAEAATLERGRRIFERADVGCASCHHGESYSDGQVYPLLGLPGVKTRSLRGIGATAPYFHDGSAPTIEAVLDAAKTGAMGNTGMLNEAELRDLGRYVESL